MVRLVFVYLLGLCYALGLSGIDDAVAGNVERTCVVPKNEINNPIYQDAFVSVKEIKRPRCEILFSGEIRKGDAEKIVRAIKSSPHVVINIEFDSPGGDAFEGLRIADVLNANFIQMTAPIYAYNGSCVPSQCGRICASACALAFLASDQRVGNRVYIHRPTFDQEMFSGLSAGQANAQYNIAVKSLREELLNRKIPSYIIERMMEIPSDQVEVLPSNYPAYSAWLDEWLAAKCGRGFMNTIGADFDTPRTDQEITEAARNEVCRFGPLGEERKRLQMKED